MDSVLVRVSPKGADSPVARPTNYISSLLIAIILKHLFLSLILVILN